MTNQKTQKDTSVKQLESEIQSLKQALELKDAQLKEKTELLELAQQHLVSQKRLADIGTLVTGILHEIVNHIYYARSCFGSSQRNLERFRETLQETPDLDTEEAKESWDKILYFYNRTSIFFERAMSLTRVMKLQAYKGISTPSLLDLNQSIETEFQIIEAAKTIDDRSLKIKFELDFDSSIGEITLVAEDFIRILTNLLTNAFDSIITKRKRLGENYEPEIKIKTIKDKEVILVEISDNGEGIPKDLLEKIFEPFVTTKPSSEGTGIGLSIVHDLANKNQWKVEVDSQEGQGAKFKLIFSLND